MRNVIVYLLGVAIALWLGGLIALFMFVSTLFINDRATAVIAAPQLFRVFDRYQLIVAAVAIGCAIGWRFYSGSRLKNILLGLLLIAAGLAVVEFAWVAPNLNGSRAVDTETFQRFHVISRWVYQSIALCVLVAGVPFLRAIQLERNMMNAPRGFPVTPKPAAGDQTSAATAQA